jgi:hypothetical protein
VRFGTTRSLRRSPEPIPLICSISRRSHSGKPPALSSPAASAPQCTATFASPTTVALIAQHPCALMCTHSLQFCQHLRVLMQMNRESAYAAARALRLPWPTYNETLGGELHPAFGDVDGDAETRWCSVSAAAATAGLRCWTMRPMAISCCDGCVSSGPGTPASRARSSPASAISTAMAMPRSSPVSAAAAMGSSRSSAAPTATTRISAGCKVSFSSWRTLNGETHPAVDDRNGDGHAGDRRRPRRRR